VPSPPFSPLPASAPATMTSSAAVEHATLLVAVYGLPGAGKSTMVRAAAQRLTAGGVAVCVVELDDLLAARRPAPDAPFDPAAWLDARDQFIRDVARVAAEAPPDASVARVVVAVDNLPLRSMRKRLRAAAVAAARDLPTSSLGRHLAFVTVGCRCSVTIAVERNAARREPGAAVPEQIIRLMGERIEFGGDAGEGCDVVLDVDRAECAEAGAEELVRFVARSLDRARAGHSPPLVRCDATSASDAEPCAPDAASTSSAHQLDVARRRANGAVIAAAKAAGCDGAALRGLARELEVRLGPDVDRRVLRSCGGDAALATLELGLMRDEIAARFVPRSHVAAEASPDHA
jgi:adenylylsulfate kinase-like enzyme